MKEFYLTKFLKLWPPHMAVVRAFEAENLKNAVHIKSPVLDLGCGDGKFSTIVLGKSDVGIDISAKEIKKAHKLGSYLALHCCDAHSIPYPDNYFKTIFSNCVVEHITDPDDLVREISRVLSEKGEFVFTTWTPDFEKYSLINKDWYKRWKNKRLKHFSIKSIQQWGTILKKNRLQMIETKYYLNSRKIKMLDFLEFVSLIGFWKFRFINLYKILAPFFPTFFMKKLTKYLTRYFFQGGSNKETSCAILIKAVKKIQ